MSNVFVRPFRFEAGGIHRRKRALAVAKDCQQRRMLRAPVGVAQGGCGARNFQRVGLSQYAVQLEPLKVTITPHRFPEAAPTAAI
jgi:hypothetical protein